MHSMFAFPCYVVFTNSWLDAAPQPEGGGGAQGAGTPMGGPKNRYVRVPKMQNFTSSMESTMQHK